MKRKVSVAAAVPAAVVLAFWLGMTYQKFRYEDTCLDLGGGSNPGGYPICVVEPSNRGFWLGPLLIGPADVEQVSYRASTTTLSEVEITLSAEAAQKVHDHTQAHVGKNLRILLVRLYEIRALQRRSTPAFS